MSNDDPIYTTGDLAFVVKELPHPVFTRVGNDLYVKVSIDAAEAVSGFSRSFTHFDNHTVEVKHEGVTTPGMQKKVQYEGMPIHESGSNRGDLYAEVKVVLPQSLSEKQKENLKAFFDSKR